jgi:acyl-CoA thioesterase
MPEKLDSVREAEIRADFPRYPFPAFLGIEIESLETGCARLSLNYRPELSQGMGFIHAGAITALCDTAVAVAVFTMTEPGEKVLTVELKVNFLAPADRDIVATAKILHKGRRTAVGEVDVNGADGALVAKALVTYYVYKDQ